MPPLPVIYEEEEAPSDLSEPLLVRHRDGQEEDLFSSSSSSDETDEQTRKGVQLLDSSTCSAPLIASAPTSSDATIARVCPLKCALQAYVKYMSQSVHKDRGLKFLSYTLVILGALLQKRSRTQRSARAVLALNKLSLDLFWARYAFRLLDLPAALEAVWTNSWAYSSTRFPRLQNILGRCLAGSMIGYYPTEYLAFVQWMVPSLASNRFRDPKSDGRSAERWSAISCRFWLLYIITESVQCVLQWKELTEVTSKQKDTDTEEQRQSRAVEESTLRWTKLQLLRNALYLLPCITWSLPEWDRKPWLPKNTVNTLMWLEAIVSLYQ